MSCETLSRGCRCACYTHTNTLFSLCDTENDGILLLFCLHRLNEEKKNNWRHRKKIK